MEKRKTPVPPAAARIGPGTEVLAVCAAVVLLAGFLLGATLLALLAVLLMIAWMIRPIPGTRLTGRLSLSTCALFAYVLLGGVSVLYAASGKFVLRALSALLVALAFHVWILVKPDDSEHTVGRVLRFFAGIAAVFSVLSIDAGSARLFTGLLEQCFPALQGLSTGYQEGTRIFGILGNPNVTGGIFALGILLSLPLISSAETKGEFRIAAFLLTGNALGFLLSFSMGAIGVFLLAILLYLAAARSHRIPALIVMVETAVTTLLSAVLSIPGLGADGAIRMLPILMIFVNWGVFCLLHQGVGRRLSRQLGEHPKAAYAFLGGILVLAAVYLVLGLNVTGPYTLTGSELRRAVYPDAGAHTLVTQSDGVSVRVESQDSNQVMMHTSTVLYDGPAEEADFQVPEDSRVVYLNFYGEAGARIESAAVDGQPVKLDYRLLPSFAANRIQGLLANENAIQRMVFFEDGLKLFRQSPVIGLGLGAFEGAVRSVQSFYYATKYAHNHYIQLLAELGIVGCGLFIAALLGAAWSLWNGRKKETNTAYYPALCAALLMMAGHAMVEVVFSYLAYLVLAFGVLGLITLCYGEPFLQKERVLVRIKQGGAVLLTVICVLLAGNLCAKAIAANPSGLSFHGMKLASDLDVFEKNDYQLSYLVNSMQSEDSQVQEQAAKYASRLSKIPSESIPKYLTAYYLSLQDYDAAFASASSGIAYTRSDPDEWNTLLHQFDNAAAQAPADVDAALTDRLGELYDSLCSMNQDRMEAVLLDPQSNSFLNQVLALRADDSLAPEDVFGKVMFCLDTAPDADGDGLPDAWESSSPVERQSDGDQVTGGTTLTLSGWYHAGGIYALQIRGTGVDGLSAAVRYGDGEVTVRQTEDGGFRFELPENLMGLPVTVTLTFPQDALVQDLRISLQAED